MSLGSIVGSNSTSSNASDSSGRESTSSSSSLSLLRLPLDDSPTASRSGFSFPEPLSSLVLLCSAMSTGVFVECTTYCCTVYPNPLLRQVCIVPWLYLLVSVAQSEHRKLYGSVGRLCEDPLYCCVPFSFFFVPYYITPTISRNLRRESGCSGIYHNITCTLPYNVTEYCKIV